MITKMKKLTFLIYHKDYECFLQNIRDLGVVHVAEKAQGTAENTELQESIRLSDHYASTIKFLQGFNVELQEQKGDTARGEKALEEVEAGLGVLTVVKGVVVIQVFLEMRHAPALWRWLLLGWLALVIALVALAYLLGRT
jgi:hypothetical protein